jgi:hypothetical protein
MLLSDIQYSINFEKEGPRKYPIGDGQFAYPSSDFTASTYGEAIFAGLKELIEEEANAIRRSPSSLEAFQHHGYVMMELRFVARRAVVEWEEQDVKFTSASADELLEIEAAYYENLEKQFNEQQLELLKTMDTMYAASNEREEDIRKKVESYDHLHDVLAGFAEKYLPLMRQRTEEIKAQLAQNTRSTPQSGAKPI